MRRLLLASILLVACGDGTNGPPTLEDSAEVLAEVFCQKQVNCGRILPSQHGACVDFNTASICEKRWDCSEEPTEEHQAQIDQCAEELQFISCLLELPPICAEALGV